MHTDMSISLELHLPRHHQRLSERQFVCRSPPLWRWATMTSLMHFLHHPKFEDVPDLSSSARSGCTAIVPNFHTNLPTQAAPPLTHLSMNLYRECQGSKRINQLFLAIGGVGKRNNWCQHTSTIVLQSTLLQMKRNWQLQSIILYKIFLSQKTTMLVLLKKRL